MKEPVHTEGAPKALGPYSQAIKVNGMLFASGQIPLDPATGELIEGTIAHRRGVIHKLCLSVDAA